MLFLSLLLLSLNPVHASHVSRDTGSKVSLPISTRINTAGIGNVVEKDQARIQFLRHAHHNTVRSALVNVSNAVFFSTVEVGVGTPPTNHTLLVDTGSSNTWVGAKQPYVATKSSVNTGNTVSVRYGSGTFDGEEWLDTITLTHDLVVNKQSIGVASSVAGIHGFDGILGLGPIDLTQNSVDNTFQVPTVMDNLHALGKISQQVLGVLFYPSSKLGDKSGELMFGGYDHSVITSAVDYVPLTTTVPAAQYWGINLSISYGDTTLLSSTAGIVDTGTTLIYIALEAFQKYQSLTGATQDANTGLLTITPAQYAHLKTLTFEIGSTHYGLPPNAQIWPRALNTAIGGNASAIYLVVNNIGYPAGSGLDFVNGFAFLQRFYSVFDATHRRMGFAKTIHTNSKSN